MSFAANQRIVSKVKYADSQDFNYCIEELAQVLDPLCEKSNFLDDSYSYPTCHWEIDPDDLGNAIKKLREKDDNEIAFDTISYGKVVSTLTKWLDTYKRCKRNLNGFIEIDWF